MDTAVQTTVRLIEELSLNAWPSLQTLCYDGWLLRFANGYTRRANSINALYASTLDMPEKIAFCERAYAARGLNVVFKLTGAVEPRDLDARLEDRGYQYDAHTGVFRLDDLSHIPAPEYQDAEIVGEATDRWLAMYCELSGVAPQHIPTMKQMLGYIASPKAFIVLRQNGDVVAAGLAVLERGYVGLYDIVTAAHKRGQGFGTQLMRHLLHWARTHGGQQGYLQVMKNNAPALRLYDKLGFYEIYDYWYRVKRSELSA